MVWLSNLRQCRARLLGWLVAPALCALGAHGPAAEPPAAAVSPSAAVQVQVLDLAACRHIAMSKQPAVAAAQASLAAAEARARAVEDLRIPTCIKRDLPVRRHQAALGVGIAQAGLNQAEAEALYAVSRNYFSVLYARQQREVADQALANLKGLKESLEELVKNGTRADVNSRHVEKVGVYIGIVEGRLQEAEEGVERATAALREAMGVGAEVPLVLADQRLPDLSANADREQLLALALARRAELVQANLAAEVVCEEVTAQGLSRMPTAKTFASASDIHAQQVPQGMRNGEYRPGALPLEMPVTLVGSKSARQEQARDLAGRAAIVVDKTRNLITLETEDNYYKWVEARDKLAKLRPAAKNAEEYFNHVQDDFKQQNTKTPPDDLLNAGILMTQARLQVNDAHHRYLLGLAALERVTAGGFCPGFEAPRPAAP